MLKPSIAVLTDIVTHVVLPSIKYAQERKRSKKMSVRIIRTVKKVSRMVTPENVKKVTTVLNATNIEKAKKVAEAINLPIAKKIFDKIEIAKIKAVAKQLFTMLSALMNPQSKKLADWSDVFSDTTPGPLHPSPVLLLRLKRLKHKFYDLPDDDRRHRMEKIVANIYSLMV